MTEKPTLLSQILCVIFCLFMIVGFIFFIFFLWLVHRFPTKYEHSDNVKRWLGY